MGPPVEFVTTPEAAVAALARLDEPVVGVDVERADAHRYFRRAALVQVGTPVGCVLLDPLALPDLAVLDEFLADRLAILHAIENDIDPLTSAGVTLREVADTAVAAALLGLPTGLGPLLRSVLGVALTDDKEAFQRADWERRPLTDGMIAYAAGDVVDLPTLWAELARRLDEAGRRDWYDQELAATLERVDEDQRAWTRVKGAGRLSSERRAILRALWERREALARAEDIAPNRIIHDAVLLDLANQPADSPQALVRRSQRRRRPLRRFADDLFDAQESGRAAEPEQRETPGRRWSDEDRAAYDAMRHARAEVADDIGIDAGVLCPSRPLWHAVAGDPADADELCELAGLRPWQRALLADPLWEAYTSGRDGAGPTDEADGSP